MEDNLVIVESPAKAKTIEKFLGKDFLVKSSFGHIRDLAKKDFGIDTENEYTPNYEVSADKRKVVSELRKLSKAAKTVWLASDEDREGEAIAWHLAEELKLKAAKTKRIVFHEITKNAILNAIKNPRDIDQNLVDAQQARRILDRLVGFELSPVLWRKVKPSLSAGRVQSVAVKLLVEREREIINFKTESAYKITAIFKLTDDDGNSHELKAELPQRLKSQKEAKDFLEKCKPASFSIQDIEKKPGKKSPSAPFTTSTLQQEASIKLGYSVAQTMTIAQKLYESGKITYMRTDSVNLSETAMQAAKNAIVADFGEKYAKARRYKTKAKGAQEAHEAIRPTSMERVASSNYSEQRLYELIWRRTMASQMSDALLEKTTVKITISTLDVNLVASGEILKFDGFLKIYGNNAEKSKAIKGLLPPLKKNQVLDLDFMEATERFTNHPPRFTEASLVKKLEELGIGRPSTYAPTISTIQKRTYVIKEDRDGKEREYDYLKLKSKRITQKKQTEITGTEKAKLFPTDIGMVVNDFLQEHFDEIMDFNFTAKVEKDFDKIASGKLVWNKMIDQFYKPFHKQVTDTIENSERNTGERILGKDPETGKTILVRIGKFGPIVQLGESGDENEKPIFASLQKDQHLETITFEEAIIQLKHSHEGRYLGDHPKSGKKISARIGRFGPMVQLGEQNDTEKPEYASLKKGQTVDTISLEEALDLLRLPRTIGTYEDKVVVAAIGRFGPYIRHDAKFVSLKKTDDPYTIELERGIELIEEKREKDRKKLIKEFDKSEIKVIKDRWNRPCIFYKKKYYSLSKEIVPEDLSLKDCKKIIDENTTEKKTTKKKSTTKKTAAKKTTKKAPAKKKVTKKK